ncbi:hypothetical protein TNCV_751151 [Trichonephila clavipes]|nr:hypothetical protein TNCV_751151 [Trichonephila clavipes]
MSLYGGELSVFEKEDLRNRSLNLAEQFHSDASLETVDRRAPNNSKNWHWTAGGGVRMWRSTRAPHGRRMTVQHGWQHVGLLLQM